MTASSLQTFQADYPQALSHVGDGDWAWRDTGRRSDRIPLVFLPGAGGTGDVFYRAADQLKAVRRIITVRYPALSEPSAIVAGLAGLLDEIGATRVDVAASSLGGYLAQELAIEQPALVRRLLLGNTFFDASWLQAKISREVVLSTPPDEHLARTIAQLDGLPEDSREQADYKATMLSLVGTEQTGEMAVASLAAVLGTKPLGSVGLPQDAIAILDTEDDPVVDAATKGAMRDRYPGSTHYGLKTGGHYPSLLNPVGYTSAVMAHFGRE